MNGKLLLPCFLLFKTHFKSEWQLQDHTLFLVHLDEKQDKKRTGLSPLPDMERSVQKSIHYYFEGQTLVTSRLSGWRAVKERRERWGTVHPDTGKQQWYCNIAAADLWAETLIGCSIKLRARKKLTAYHQRDPQKTNSKVPLAWPPSMYLLVSGYWWLSTTWLKEGLASCVSALLGKKQTGGREMH